MAEDRPRPMPGFTDREPLPSGLIPAERLAFTVARAQIERGENPPVNITTALVMTIDRLTSGPGQCIRLDSPKPYAFTRDQLVAALTAIQFRPVNGKVVADWVADAIISALEDPDGC